MLSPIEKTASILQKAKEDVLQALEGRQQESVSISVISGLTTLINRLSFITGHTPATANASVEFPPVTNFFGDEITRTKDIVKEDLKPTLTEKEIFLSKVDALQSTIKDRQPETLISDFSNEPRVLRGVAKRAGLEDYEDGIINIDFIERIKEGLTNNEALAEQEAEINKQLAGEGETTDPLSTTRTIKQAKTTKADNK